MATQKPRFDYSVYGVPMMMYHTDRILSVMENGLRDGMDGYEIVDLMKEEGVRQLREDPTFQDRLRDVYRKADVNVFSPTIAVSGPNQHRLDRWHARVNAVDWLHAVTSPEHTQRVIDEDGVGVLINTQNLGMAIGGDLEEIERLYNGGLRMGQLTYNSQNLLGAGCTERVDGGLSNLGVKAVERMNELGMVVDLSHCGKQTTLDAVETSDSPVAFTHTGCQAVSDHVRMKSDEELEALAENDGYLGLVTIPSFMAAGREVEAFEVFFEHVEHARSILGIDQIGLGSDWCTMTPPSVPEALQPRLEEAYRNAGWDEVHNARVAQGFGPISNYSEWRLLQEAFSDRGYSESEIDGVFGENFMTFWTRSLQE